MQLQVLVYSMSSIVDTSIFDTHAVLYVKEAM